MKRWKLQMKMAQKFTLLFAIVFGVSSLLTGTLDYFKTSIAGAVAPTNTISYQGRILNANGVPVSDASADMVFELYDAVAAGTCLWSNSSSTCASATAISVTLTDGLFAESLGDTGSGYAAIPDSVFANNATVYLQVTIEGETLSPRQLMNAVPYALNAQTLDGLNSDAFLLATGDTATGDFDFSGAIFLDASPLVFEGLTDDGFQTTFAFDDPTGANVITFQDGTGTVAFLTDIGSGSLFTDGGAVTYLTSLTDDFAIGGTDPTASPFGVDESGNTIYVGEGANANGAIIFKASDAATGTVTYTTSDRWEFTGGNLVTDSDLAVNGGDITTTATTWNFDVGNTGSILFRDGTNTLFTIADAGTTGNITASGDLAVNGGDITTTATTWNFDVGNTGSIVFRDGTNTLMTLADGGTVGNLNVSGDLTVTGDNIDSAGAPLILNLTAADEVRIGSGTPGVATGDGDLYVTDALEVDGAGDFGGTVTAADFSCTDCLDFTELSDTLTLDASTSLNVDTFNFSMTQNALSILDMFTLTTSAANTMGILLDANADAGNGVTEADGGAFHIANGGNAGVAFSIHSSNAAPSGSLMYLETSSATFDEPMVWLEQDGTGESIFVLQGESTGGTISSLAGGAVHISNTGNNDQALSIYTNNSTSASDLVEIRSDHASFANRVMNLRNDGTGGVLFLDQNGGTGVALDIDSESTTSNVATFDGSALTTGYILSLVGGNFTDDSGMALSIDVTEATATADIFRIQTDVGVANNNVFRIEADGEAFSDIGFTAGAFSTNYYDGSITSTGTFTIDSSGTVQLGEDDDFLPQLGAGDADIGAVGTRWDNLYVSAADVSGTATVGDLSCTDCLDFAEFEDTLDLDANLTLNQGTNTWTQNYTGAASTAYTFNANSLSTGGGIIGNFNALTSAYALGVFTTSGVLTSATLMGTDHTATYTATTGASGPHLDLNRALTLDDSLAGTETLTVSGNMVDITSSMSLVSGFALNDSSTLLGVTQNYGNATGNVFTVTNWGSGSGVYIQQSGETLDTTLSDTSDAALHINNTANGQFGLTVYSGAVGAVSDTPLVQFETGTGFDMPVLRLQSDGSGSALDIFHTGDTLSTVPAADAAAAISIDNTSNDAMALSIYSNQGGPQDAPLVYYFAESASFDQHVQRIDNAGSRSSLFIDQNGPTGVTISDTLGGALHITNTGNADSGLTVYSNASATTSPLTQFYNDNTLFDTAILHLNNDSTQAASVTLQIDQLNANEGAAAFDINARTSAFMVQFFNDGNSDAADGVAIQACADVNPSASCDFIKFHDGDGGIVGAIEGNGAGGVVLTSGAADFAELFPGVRADFEVGDVIALSSSGSVEVAQNAQSVIGAFSRDRIILGNALDENWEATGAWVPVALLGQVPIKVNAEGGAIAPGDYLTLSSTPGVAMKATNVGYMIGRALESSSGAGTEVIQVYLQPGWNALEMIVADGSTGTFAGDFAFAETGTATSGLVGMDSHALTLRGSGWNGVTAEAVEMVLLNDVTDAGSYNFVVKNTLGEDAMRVSQAGDLAIAGRLYPSDRGVLQTDKYIFYDGSAGPGGDFMRTNAAGWATGSYDFAEMFPSVDVAIPGEVVIFADGKEQVKRSTGVTYDMRIAGIVSTRPGFLAGENKPGDVPIALAGRVPTFVTNENGEIKPGDPLTTSSTPGYAMKASKPGSIIGYAMEAFSGDKGKITVYVRASYYAGGVTNEAPATQNTASGATNLSNLSFNGTLNMNGGNIINVASVSHLANKWRIEDDGTFLTRGRIKQLIRSHQGEDVETYPALSRESTIQLSGSVQLMNGSAVITFEHIDPSFNDIIAPNAPYRVFVTPDQATQTLYVVNRTMNGFTIQESNAGQANALVDWLVIAYHKDFAPQPKEDVVAEETVEETTPITPVAEEPVEEIAPETSSETISEIPTDTPIEPIQTEEPPSEPVSESGDEPEVVPQETEDTVIPIEQETPAEPVAEEAI